MKRRKLIFLIGQSGSGKDTAVNYLVERYGWHAVSSFTTRPMRSDEVNGREHTFLTWGAVACNPDEWLQHRGLHLLAKTLYGGHYYFTAMEQLTHHITGSRRSKSADLLHEPIMRAVPTTRPVVYIINEDGFMGIMQRDAVARWLSDNFDYELWYISRNDKNVSDYRTNRDDKRTVIADSAYKHIIHNDYDIDYLHSYLDAIVKRM